MTNYRHDWARFVLLRSDLGNEEILQATVDDAIQQDADTLATVTSVDHASTLTRWKKKKAQMSYTISMKTADHQTPCAG